jgi:hypothetical protein
MCLSRLSTWYRVARCRCSQQADVLTYHALPSAVVVCLPAA